MPLLRNTHVLTFSPLSSIKRRRKFALGCVIPFCYVGAALYIGAIILEVNSAPMEIGLETGKETGSQNGEPVWSHGESFAFASATGDGAILETDSWTAVDNHGGLHVNNITSDGTLIGYQVSGLTNCSQESTAYAAGAWSANALAYGNCNSSVLVDQPVSNTGYGN